MLTLFSFGYYGWGNSTPQLVQAVDSVERSRGSEPPVFVDIRIRRAVRAVGFCGNAFGDLLGEKRHRWMKSLGNRHIETRAGSRIQIAEPAAVNDLLDLAAQAAEDGRRIIFFCGCKWPRLNGRVNCHRTTVATLTLLTAKRRGLSVEVVEWPGGEPSLADLAVGREDFGALLRGKCHIPVKDMSLGESAGIAWGSTARIHCNDQQMTAVVGPAQFNRRQWQLPVLSWEQNNVLADLRQSGASLRKAFGCEARYS